MNPHFLRAVIAMLSLKGEFKVVLWTFIFALSLPLIAVFTIANTGIGIVSDAIVKIDVVTHLIQIRDATGNVVAEIQAASTWPIKGTVTLEFGVSHLPYQPLHTGIDIATTRGDPVTAFMRGKVSHVGNLSWGYGKHVIVEHENNITSLYAHFDTVLVKEGQEVAPGDVLGLEGSTGWSTGPHVHFEVRVFGIPVNPRTFVEGEL